MLSPLQVRAFQSTLSLRRATLPALLLRLDGLEFQSTLSLRRATPRGNRRIGQFGFQSTLSLRRATSARYPRLDSNQFQSTLSLRRATVHSGSDRCRNLFQSTLSLRRATRHGGAGTDQDSISIHALLAESDQAGPVSGRCWEYFNPRSPCGERLGQGRCAGLLIPKFQSTLSLRRATYSSVVCISAPRDFNPRSPCGERQDLQGQRLALLSISIHALLAESDQVGFRYGYALPDFNPRSPCGERPLATTFAHVSGYFNPRSPCGERHLWRVV